MNTIDKPIYFLSDVHLGVSTKSVEFRKQQLLLALLREVEAKAHALYIVGDLFDFWFEYTHVIPRGYHLILAALHRLVLVGVEVTYLHGNHDFAAGNAFVKDMGIKVLPDDHTFECDGKKFYLFHGDGLAQHDAGYRILKKIIRHPLSKAAFRLLHPDFSFSLASFFSKKSRDYTGTKRYGEIDGMLEFAQNKMKAGFDFVIMGHRHIPARTVIGNGVYINLGDWMRHFSYAVFKEGKMELMTMADGDPQPLETV
jgi:UDP-2,3-diacylglucosamine hydrolase